jgi:cell division septal protein FtsQ
MEKYRLKHKKNFRIKKKKSIFRKKRFWFFLFFLIIFGIGAYYFFYYKIFEIKEILIFGNEKVKREEIRSLIEEKINHKILFIKTKNVFLADINEINQAVLSKFPRIQKIKTSKNLLGILSAEITERQVIGNLCNANNCYLFDKEGVVFDTATEDKRISIKIEPNDYQPVLGKQEISKEIVAGLLTLDKILKDNFSVELEEILLFLNQQKLEVKTSEGWKIYFEPKENFDSQILNLNLLLKEEIFSKNRKNLDSIDLRYGNKIFYKEK